MKMIVVVFALVAAAIAAPPASPGEASIVRSEFVQDPAGGFSSSFETENGIRQSVTGELKEAFDEENKPHQVVVFRGAYSYIDNEGKNEEITYYADENGFHAEGPSIPVGPPANV